MSTNKQKQLKIILDRIFPDKLDFKWDWAETNYCLFYIKNMDGHQIELLYRFFGDMVISIYPEESLLAVRIQEKISA